MLSLQDNVVLSDVRFPNEIRSIKNSGGLIIRTHRGPDPEWYHAAETVNRGGSSREVLDAMAKLETFKIHASETAWIGTKFDAVLNNNGSIDDLYAQIKNLLQSLQSST
jgi:hypothetical protein